MIIVLYLNHFNVRSKKSNKLWEHLIKRKSYAYLKKRVIYQINSVNNLAVNIFIEKFILVIFFISQRLNKLFHLQYNFFLYMMSLMKKTQKIIIT